MAHSIHSCCLIPFQACSSPARKPGAATAISASARSNTVRPRRSATPCSVMTTSTMCRGNDTISSAIRGTMGDHADAAARQPGRVREIRRPAHAAHRATAGVLEVRLAEQVHAERRIHRDEALGLR